MTDNEIIKILKCCKKGDCYRCPAHKFGGRCTDKAKWMAFDLIKRQINLINRQKAEIEGWKETANQYQNLWCEAEKDVQTVKAEAIKEFAERLRDVFNQYDVELFCQTVIDNLVKEMVGDPE